MAVRPSYINVSVDGRKTDLSGGPRHQGGEMSGRIYQRNDGATETAFTFECVRDGDDIVTLVFGHDGAKVYEHRTRY